MIYMIYITLLLGMFGTALCGYIIGYSHGKKNTQEIYEADLVEASKKLEVIKGRL